MWYVCLDLQIQGYVDEFDQEPLNGSWNSQFAKHSATPLRVHIASGIKAWCFFNFASLRGNALQSFVQGLISKSAELGKYFYAMFSYLQSFTLLVPGMSKLLK